MEDKSFDETALVCRRFLDVIYNKKLHSSSLRFEFEAELRFQCFHETRPGGVGLEVGWRWSNNYWREPDGKIIFAGQSAGFIHHRTVNPDEGIRQQARERLHINISCASVSETALWPTDE